ncbi:MAG: NAD(P)-dependent oxidoreductase [Chitinispirillaceae bacterium]|nr:NAD(P)-dependent oxidoreductase [Chitinispirillaceae bacterium]
MILITGGTGAMGSVLVRKLSEQGHSLRVLTLPGDRNAERLRTEYGVDVRYGSVADASACRGLCDGADTVLHLAAIIITNDESLYTSINAGGTRNIVAQAAAAGVKHFIHVSSASVLYPKPTPYSISKRLAEDLVKKSKLPWTIVRPTLVYGQRGGQEFDMFLSYLKKFPVVPFIGNGNALKRPVFVDDVVDGLVKIACMERGKNAVYNLSGATSLSILDFARLCLTLMGKERKPVVRLPVWLCVMLAGVMKRAMRNPPLKWSVIAGVTQDADLDPSDAINELGYAPCGVEQMLPRCFPRNTKA